MSKSLIARGAWIAAAAAVLATIVVLVKINRPDSPSATPRPSGPARRPRPAPNQYRHAHLGETNGRIAHDREVVRALADVAEQHPAESMRLTTRLIRGDMEGWLASASTTSFSRMISAGVASGGQARAAGVDFANFLGAMGFREFRELV